MHPKIRQPAPGSLPDLRHGARAVNAKLDEQDNPELRDFSRRFWWTPAADRGRRSVSRCSGIGSQGWRWDPALDRIGRSARRSCSGPAGRSSCAAAQSLRSGSLNMWTLIGIGVGTALSATAWWRRSHRTLSRLRSASTARVGVYFEAAAVIVSLTLLGPDAGVAARARARRRDQGPAGPGAKDRTPNQGRRSEEDMPWPRCSRRSPARAARREGAGRWHGGRGRLTASMSRCSPANRCRSRRRAGDTLIGATMNGTGRLVMRAEQGRRRDSARADRADGGQGAAIARADAAHGRQGRVLVRARP